MKDLNPTCKFIGILIPTLLLLFFYSPVLNLLVFLISLAAVLLVKCNRKALAAAMIPIFLSALALFFTGMHFPSDSHLALHYDLFAGSAAWNGLQLSSRVLAFAGLGLLFVLTTDAMDLVRSARQQLKLPAKFAYGLLAAWNTMPNMTQEYRKARAAFQARGLSPMPWSPALLKPLLVKTIRWSEALAAAMESKGFGGGSRTEYYVSSVTLRDILFPLLTTAVFFAAVFLDGTVVSLLSLS